MALRDQPRIRDSAERLWYERAVAGDATPRTPAIAVRAARPPDAGALADLHFRSAETGFAPFVPPDRAIPTRADLERDWMGRLTGDPALERVAFVAEHAGTIVGVLVAGREPADPALGRLARCYIDPAWWGTRVGSQLFEAGVAHLRGLGCTTAVGWAMEHNRRSRERVEHLGMTPTGRRQPTCEPAVPEGIEDVEYRMAL
jgi:RimJ/RimL family protein N-acetyltransferase